MPKRKIPNPDPGPAPWIDMRTGEPAASSQLPLICARIRPFRERLGMEQKTLAAELNVSSNAVSNWENGRSRPDINLIPALCRVLKVSLYALYGMEEPVQWSPRERSLIGTYRELSDGHKLAVEQLAGTLLAVQREEGAPRLRVLPLFSRSLAAGIGDPTEFEDSSTPLFLYEDRILPGADCVFSVSGESMEPDFHDGDRVLVQRIPDAPRLTPGEIGAFIAGNETFIKRYEEDGLYSLNPAYAPMHFSDETSVYLIGRVLGVLDPSAAASPQEAEQPAMIHRR